MLRNYISDQNGVKSLHGTVQQFKPVPPSGAVTWSSLLSAIRVKVTVQFETEGNGQNEIVSHMDRLEVKL